MPAISLKAESFGNTFGVSTCAPVGFTLEWLVYSSINPSLCLYYVITGAPGYCYYYYYYYYYYYSLLKKHLIAGQKGCCYTISCESPRRGT